MSIFSRIFNLGKAHTNQVLDKLEKPEVMLDQAIRNKEKQIRDAKKAIQSCIATERQTKKLLDQEKSEQLIWEQRAKSALQQDKEDLAAKALQRSSEHEQKVMGLQANWESQRQAVDELKRDIIKMEDELNDFRRNKDFIIAQSKAAEVKKSIYEAKAKISKNRSADDLMERMKRKAERQTNEAEAAKELADMSNDGKDSLEKEFEDLGASEVSPSIQEKLAQMKAELGQNKPANG